MKTIAHFFNWLFTPTLPVELFQDTPMWYNETTIQKIYDEEDCECEKPKPPTMWLVRE